MAGSALQPRWTSGCDDKAGPSSALVRCGASCRRMVRVGVLPTDYRSADVYDAVFVGIPSSGIASGISASTRPSPSPTRASSRSTCAAGHQMVPPSAHAEPWPAARLRAAHSDRTQSAAAAEKRAAHQLGLAESTTHQHVVAIFRKFGVHSHAGLMSLWFNRPAARTAHFCGRRTAPSEAFGATHGKELKQPSLMCRNGLCQRRLVAQCGHSSRMSSRLW
jgi:hypothetical protein